MSEPRPNIIVILTDDQRADSIAALGNSQIRTPVLDRLVADGTVCRNAYIMGGTQPAVCCPSRNMLLTGRTLFRIGGKYGEAIPPEHLTMPEFFRNHGYHTHHIGKWHQDRESFRRSFDGADRVFGFTPGWYVQYGGHWNVAVHDFDPTGRYAPEAGYLLAADKRSRLPLVPGLGGVHSSEMFSDAAVDFLRRRSAVAAEPFFLYLAYVAPHDPRQAPQRYEAGYDACTIDTPANFLERHPFDNGEFSVRDEMLEAWPRREHAVKRHLADYYACIEHLDAQIGRVMATLGETGLRERTIVVFASDNGLGIGSHGLMGKQNLYEHSVRVPLVFSGPGFPAGAYCDDFCYLSDVFASLGGRVGLPVPDSVEGTDVFAAVASGADREQPRTMYYAYRGVQRAVRDGRYKLIEYVAADGRHTQLFDVTADRHETTNLADQPQCRLVVDRMRAMLLTQRGLLADTRAEEAAFWRAFEGAPMA